MAKIESNFPTPVPLSHPTRKASGKPVDGVADTAAVAGTQNAPASNVTSVQPAASSSAPVDAAKVAKLRAAVLDGSYKPNASKIADKLVDLEKKLP